MRKSFWVLILLFALTFTLQGCGDNNNNGGGGAQVTETTVAALGPGGGFVTACPSFLGGGDMIVAISPTCGRSVALPNFPNGGQINGLAQSGSLIVAVGTNGLVLFSTDGGVSFNASTDSEVLTSGTDLNAVAIGNGSVVAVGGNGTIVTNSVGSLGTDGSWTAQTSGTTNQLNGVTTGGPGWVVVGDGGTVLTSPNLTTWTAVTDSVVTGVNHNAVITDAAGNLVVVGDGGSIVVLPAGQTTFVAVSSGTSNNLNDLNVVPGPAVVAVGDGGTVISATDSTVASGSSGGWTSNEDQLPSGTGTDFQAITVTDDSSQRVVITGDGQVLEATTQSGTPARVYTDCDLGALRGVHGTADDNVFYVGENGLIVHRNGNGLNLVPSPTDENLNAVFATGGGGGTQAWAVGEAGDFIQINDQALNNECNGGGGGSGSGGSGSGGSGSGGSGSGGSGSGSGSGSGTGSNNSPAAVALPGPGSPLNSIFGTGSTNIFAVGDGGVIWRLTDAATPNWTRQSSPTGSDLNGVWATPFAEVDEPNDFLVVAVASSGQVIGRDAEHEFSVIPLSTSIGAQLNAVTGCFNNNNLTMFTAGNGGQVFQLTPQLGTGGEVTSLNVTNISPTFTNGTPNLLGIWCQNPSNVFTVGTPTANGATALQWDGTNWSNVNQVTNSVSSTAVLNGVFGFDGTVDFVGQSDAAAGSDNELVRI